MSSKHELMSLFSSKTSTEIDRKTLKQPDSFMTALKKFFDKLAERRKELLAVLVAFVLVGIGISLYLNHKENQAELARAAFFKAEQVLESELKVIAEANVPPAEKKKNTDSKGQEPPQQSSVEKIAYKKFAVDSQLAKSTTMFRDVEKKYKGTRSAFDARLALGDLYFDHGDAEKSISWYEKATKTAPSKADKTIAFYALGYAYENTKKLSDALGAYEKALASDNGTLKGDLLLALARCYEGQRDISKAKITYDKIIAQLPNTDSAKSAEVFKANLE